MSVVRFAATGRNTFRTTQRTTCVGVTSSASSQGGIYELAIASTNDMDTPPVRRLHWVISRYRSPGVSICLDPVKLHPGSRSAHLTAGERHSVEPTYLPTAPLFEQWLDPRATFHWYASPGEGILIPATTCDGVGIASVARSPGEVGEAMVHWEE